MYKFIAICLLLFVCNQATACGICGCAGGFTGLGYVPGVQLHFVGVRYRFNYSNSMHPPLFSGDAPTKSTDLFHTVELWGRYVPHKNVLLHLSVPFHSNIIIEDGNRNLANGIGDPMLSMHYRFVKTKDTSRAKVRHMLFGGFGVQFPMGRNNFYLKDSIWAPNFQPGKSSFGFWLNANYSILSGAFGMFADASAIFYTNSSNNYHYGNQYSGAINGFYNFLLPGWRFMPQIGAEMQYKQKDLLNARERIVNTSSGGWQTNFVVGLDVYARKVGMRLQFKQPIASNVNSGQVRPGQAVIVQFFYFINS